MKIIGRLTVAALCALLLSGAAAEPEGPLPAAAVETVTYIDVALARSAVVAGLLRRYRDAVREEDGNLGAELYQEIGSAYHFVIDEQWRDRASLDAHAKGVVLMQLRAALQEAQNAPPDSHVFEPYDVAPVRPRGGGQATVYGITHVEIAPVQAAAFRTLAADYARASRADGGGMRFDVLKETGSETRFMLFESWTAPRDFEAHRTAAHARHFREALAPIGTGYYEDRLFGKFN
jgi:quinol monooxygenase YgiN